VNMFGQNPVLHLNGDVTSLASDSYGDIGGRLDFLGGQRKFIVADGLPTPDLIVSAVIQGGNGFTMAGPGTLELTGSNANTYSGTVQVAEGTLELAKASGVAITGNLDVGDFLGSADTLRLLANNQIITTAPLT